MTTKTVNNAIQDTLEPMSAALLIEHERIASLYEHNVKMGDQLVITYLTAVSLAVTLLLGMRELMPQSDSLILFEGAMLTIIISAGLTTFRRLIERRVRAIEYLRAINRIHRYFVDKDSSIQQYLYWPASDDCPPYVLKVHC